MKIEIEHHFHLDENRWVTELTIDDKFGAYFGIYGGEVYMLDNDDHGNLKKLKYEEFKTAMEEAIEELKKVIEEDTDL